MGGVISLSATEDKALISHIVSHLKQLSIYLTFALFCSFPINILCDDLDSDEPWDLENLDPSELDSLQSDREFQYHNSYGWFPSTWWIDSYMGITWNAGSPIDFGNNIAPEGIYDINQPYSTSRPLPDNEIREMYSALDQGEPTERTGDYGPILESYRIGIGLAFTTGLPLWIDLQASYYSSTNIAYTDSPNKRYRNRNGTINRFTEGNYLVADHCGISYGAMACIPVYGSFISSQGLEVFNSYEFLIGFDVEQTLSYTISQYSQIEGAAEWIRYDNGFDTLQLYSTDNLESFNDNRYYLPIGIGWNGGGGPVQLSLSITYSIGLTCLFSDDSWNNNIFNTRISFKINPWWI